eukprot:GDKJ01036167.1.p1 GENE.GDKJ01036167.1~~GDKJ01036167.1.p1  ORF type:complete len:884 (+),score=188.39 GDKJ01036167.1:37-2688(+)
MAKKWTIDEEMKLLGVWILYEDFDVAHTQLPNRTSSALRTRFNMLTQIQYDFLKNNLDSFPKLKQTQPTITELRKLSAEMKIKRIETEETMFDFVHSIFPTDSAHQDDESDSELQVKSPMNQMKLATPFATPAPPSVNFKNHFSSSSSSPVSTFLNSRRTRRLDFSSDEDSTPIATRQSRTQQNLNQSVMEKSRNARTGGGRRLPPSFSMPSDPTTQKTKMFERRNSQRPSLSSHKDASELIARVTALVEDVASSSLRDEDGFDEICQLTSIVQRRFSISEQTNRSAQLIKLEGHPSSLIINSPHLSGTQEEINTPKIVETIRNRQVQNATSFSSVESIDHINSNAYFPPSHKNTQPNTHFVVSDDDETDHEKYGTPLSFTNQSLRSRTSIPIDNQQQSQQNKQPQQPQQQQQAKQQQSDLLSSPIRSAVPLITPTTPTLLRTENRLLNNKTLLKTPVANKTPSRLLLGQTHTPFLVNPINFHLSPHRAPLTPPRTPVMAPRTPIGMRTPIGVRTPLQLRTPIMAQTPASPLSHVSDATPMRIRSCGESTLPSKEELEKRAQFNRQRERLARELFLRSRTKAFNDVLPLETEIFFSGRITSTAGRCHFPNSKTPHCRIELSKKLITDYQRLAETLLHELCHAANYHSKMPLKPSHGPAFKHWVSIVAKAYPEYPVSTYHSYTAMDMPAAGKSRPATPFNNFVKEQFNQTKLRLERETPGKISAKDVLTDIGLQWKKRQSTQGNAEKTMGDYSHETKNQENFIMLPDENDDFFVTKTSDVLSGNGRPWGELISDNEDDDKKGQYFNKDILKSRAPINRVSVLSFGGASEEDGDCDEKENSIHYSLKNTNKNELDWLLNPTPTRQNKPAARGLAAKALAMQQLNF